jgi:hypothetical protein
MTIIKKPTIIPPYASSVEGKGRTDEEKGIDVVKRVAFDAVELWGAGWLSTFFFFFFFG